MDKVNAYGFVRNECPTRFEDHLEKKYEKKQNKNLNMISYGEYKKAAVRNENAKKIIGYIPLVGAFIGLTNLAKYAFSKETRNLYSRNIIQRSLVEMTSLGIINLIFDAGIHLKRRNNYLNLGV